MNFVKKLRLILNINLLIITVMLSCSDNLSSSYNDYFENDIIAPWEGGPAYYSQWTKGPSTDNSWFPIAVWLQSPGNADEYRDIGITVFVGLWQGPQQSQLDLLHNHDMPVICSQLTDEDSGSVLFAHDDTIKAWMHMDEPDNAQALEEGGYGPPVPPSEIESLYNEMKAKDPDRPVLLNLGQGVAWDGWYGRGVRTNHPEDYPEYIKGADIVSYDIYPVNSGNDDVSDKLWLVAHGVDRLREWSGYQKAVWNWIECTRIHSDSGRTPAHRDVRAEVWMSLIHGSMGIGYFAHCIDPFDEPCLLHNDEMRHAVAGINAEIMELAPVLNTATIDNGADVLSSNPDVPVDHMMKRYNGHTYIFSVSMRPGPATATFSLRDFSDNRTVTVIGESREIALTSGSFEDSFTDYAVHLYRVKN